MTSREVEMFPGVGCLQKAPPGVPCAPTGGGMDGIRFDLCGEFIKPVVEDGGERIELLAAPR